MSRSSVLFSFTRGYARHIKSWEPEMKIYESVKYYPRHPDEVDPVFTPSKLFLVTRVKPFKGQPYWDKRTLNNLGFIDHGKDPIIVKNTPETCAKLWTVKHLVKIVPIKLPEKLPDADDLSGTYLHENGTLYITPKIDPVRMEASDKHHNSPKKLDTPTLTEKLRLQWLKGTMSL